MKLPTILLTILSAVSAVDLRGNIPPSALLPNPATLPISTTLTLSTNGLHRHALLRKDSTFTFRDIPAGSYILEANCVSHIFTPLRIDVSESGAVTAHHTFRGNPWDNLGPQLGALELIPAQKKDYFIVREGFSPVKMLMGNPMILIAVLSLAVIVGMPKIIDKLDPEFKKELEETRKKGGLFPGAPSAGQDFDVAGFLAGTSSKPQTGAGARQRKG